MSIGSQAAAAGKMQSTVWWWCSSQETYFGHCMHACMYDRQLYWLKKRSTCMWVWMLYTCIYYESTSGTCLSWTCAYALNLGLQICDGAVSLVQISSLWCIHTFTVVQLLLQRKYCVLMHAGLFPGHVEFCRRHGERKDPVRLNMCMCVCVCRYVCMWHCAPAWRAKGPLSPLNTQTKKSITIHVRYLQKSLNPVNIFLICKLCVLGIQISAAAPDSAVPCHRGFHLKLLAPSFLAPVSVHVLPTMISRGPWSCPLLLFDFLRSWTVH